MSVASERTDGAPVLGPSGWSPLRYTAFRRWWVANLTSNVGSWMQTVAAQWLMISLTSSAVLVGAIQATNLPVLALAIPGGVLGDAVALVAVPARVSALPREHFRSAARAGSSARRSRRRSAGCSLRAPCCSRAAS